MKLLFWFLYELVCHQIPFNTMYNIVIDNNQNCVRIYWTELEISVVGKTKPGSCRHMISGYKISIKHSKQSG